MRWLRQILGRRCSASWRGARCDLATDHEGKCFAQRGSHQKTWPTDYREMPRTPRGTTWRPVDDGDGERRWQLTAEREATGGPTRAELEAATRLYDQLAEVQPARRCRWFGHKANYYGGARCKRCGAWWVFGVWRPPS